MSAVHPNQVSITSHFSFREISLDDKSSRKRNASFLLNHQKSIHKCNHLGSNDKQTEDLRSEINCKKASLGSRILLNTDDSHRPKIPESKPTEFTFPSVPSDTSDNHSLVLSSTCKPEQELRIFSDVIKVKTLSPSKTAGFTAEAGKPECVKQEPSNSSENDHTVLNAPQEDRDVKSSVFNYVEPKAEICESFVSKGEQIPSLSIPVIELKTEEATKSVLTSGEIKIERYCVNASNNNSNNEDCGNSRVKFDPTVGNHASLDQTKIKTSRSETEKYDDKLIQLNIRKKKFSISNSSRFADQDNDSQTSTTAVRRKIIFSSERKKSLTKANKKIPGEKSNRLRSLLDVIPGGGGGGVKPRFSSDETNFARTNRFEGTKRRILKAKRWCKGAQRAAKKMVISASVSIPDKMCRNWGITAPSDKNTNLSVASYIRCRLSKLQIPTFRGRLEGEKVSTLANVESGRKRRLSIDNESESQRAKRCRLTFEEDDDQESEETSILDFKKSCISKLEALEKEWNEKIDLEMEAANRDYKHDFRQLQEQQSLENYTLCLKHSNQIYNGTMENMARKHWKAFRQMQNKFLLKTQNIEKKRHTQLAVLRNEFKEAGEHIQTILDSTDTQMLRNSPLSKSPYKPRRISVDTAVMLVKEDKIYDSFYTQGK